MSPLPPPPPSLLHSGWPDAADSLSDYSSVEQNKQFGGRTFDMRAKLQGASTVLQMGGLVVLMFFPALVGFESATLG